MAFIDRIKVAKHYLSGKSKSGNVYRLIVEISNICNLSCIMCARPKMKRKVHGMDERIFEKIIYENHKSLEFIGLAGYGEPLLAPNLFKFIKLCRKFKVTSGISTNVTKLKGEVVDRLLNEGPEIIILAIDSIKKENYEEVRKGASFDEVIRNAKNFLIKKEKVKKPPFVIIQSIYMPETKESIPFIKEYFLNYKVDAIRIKQLGYTGEKKDDMVFKNKYSPCYWLWAEPQVLSNGTVVPCCIDINGELSLGNIKNNTLKELWNSGRIEELRTLHARGDRKKIPLCSDCNMYQPPVPFVLGSSLFNTAYLNRKLLPRIESIITRIRYKW